MERKCRKPFICTVVIECSLNNS
uniref:Uncharacterized protein n=1 Tax=Arundo donax TaxID=35708 RepID=A0A0A9C408_ARUDO